MTTCRGHVDIDHWITETDQGCNRCDCQYRGSWHHMPPNDNPAAPTEAWEREAEEWREAAIEALAQALYRADGFRRGSITPRWEMTDRAIVEAWRKAARRYVDGGRIRRPRLVMVEDRWEDRSDD